MLRQKNYPTIFHDDDSSFVDMSLNMLSYSGDETTVELIAADDALYFGLYKPVSAMYIEMGTANTNAATFTVQYYSTTTSDFASVVGLVDETKGMTRSGFIHFNNPNDHDSTPWVSSTINSTVKYWIKITSSADFSANTSILGWNMVFSDDNDIARVYPNVINYKDSSASSWILAHEQARYDIIQTLRKDGRYKLQLGSVADALPAQMTVWDILEPNEVNQWSTFLALKNIFRVIQADPDGIHAQLVKDFDKAATEAKQVFYLTLDVDDDGKVDRAEVMATQNTSGRLYRR